jgi:hypothetical protein
MKRRVYASSHRSRSDSDLLHEVALKGEEHRGGNDQGDKCRWRDQVDVGAERAELGGKRNRALIAARVLEVIRDDDCQPFASRRPGSPCLSI